MKESDCALKRYKASLNAAKRVKNIASHVLYWKKYGTATIECINEQLNSKSYRLKYAFAFAIAFIITYLANFVANMSVSNFYMECGCFSSSETG